jgi:hypothetical protein
LALRSRVPTVILEVPVKNSALSQSRVEKVTSLLPMFTSTQDKYTMPYNLGRLDHPQSDRRPNSRNRFGILRKKAKMKEASGDSRLEKLGLGMKEKIKKSFRGKGEKKKDKEKNGEKRKEELQRSRGC